MLRPDPVLRPGAALPRALLPSAALLRPGTDLLQTRQ